jgi:phage terminase large subunit GpA-like protein
VAFHIWTAYSPQVPWSEIVREWLGAQADKSKLQAFINTTLGETWDDDTGERNEPEVLLARREDYCADDKGGDVPDGVQVVVVAGDTHDDRIELQFDGYGFGEERWTLDYVRLYGDPGGSLLWDKAAEQFRRRFTRRDGTVLDVRLACQDYGGHYSDEVAAFSRRVGVQFVIPTFGAKDYGKPLVNFPRKRNAKRIYLTEVGTDSGKTLLHNRYKIEKPGPGYVHWPVRDCFDSTYFAQVCAEERIRKWKKGVATYVWDAKKRRNEATDVSVLTLVAVRILQQHMGFAFVEPPPPATAGEVAPAPRVEPAPAGIPRRPSNYLKGRR